MIQRAEPVGLQARSFATMVLPLPRGRVDPAAVVEVHSPTLEIPPIIQVGVAAEPEADPMSCESSCGSAAPGGCWCDEVCTEYGDCCVDYEPLLKI